MTSLRPWTRDFGTGGWAVIACAVVLALAVLTPSPSSAQTFNVIYTFTGGFDGANPLAGLTMDARGNLYGTASEGGGGGQGTVYKLIHNASGWQFNRLYGFSWPAGSALDARVLFGPDGALYGTTYYGGAGYGNVFSLVPPPTPPRTAQDNHWIETGLYTFTGGSDGADPEGDLAFDDAGNIYGSTFFGGSNGGGAVFELTRSGNSWQESVLYSFTNDDGVWPVGVILQAGDFYGTTSFRGAFGNGAVFQLSPSGSGWTENVLYSFPSGNSGGQSASEVIFDGAGSMYGSTFNNGDGGYGPGTVWELMPSGGGWTFSTLYNFSAPGCSSPQGPRNAPLTMDPAGNLYGTTYADGANCYGSIFKLSPPSGGGQWTYTSLHDFTGGTDGGNPESKVIIDASGNLYGTASCGGSANCSHGYGVVWEITP